MKPNADQRAEVRRAIDTFRSILDTSRLAEEMAMEPGAAARIWRRAKKQMVKDKLSVSASRDFIAETDELFDSAEAIAVQHLATYDTERDRLSGLSAVLKQINELRQFRYQMRQDLSLIPAGRAAAGRTAAPNIPKPLRPAEIAAAVVEAAAAAAAAAEAAAAEGGPPLPVVEVEEPPPPGLTREQLDEEIQALMRMREKIPPTPPPDPTPPITPAT